MTRLCTLLSIALLCAACSDTRGPTSTAQATITDSTGIAIVQNHRPVWGEGEGWEVSAEPLLVIGPEVALGDARFIATAVRLSDGGVALMTDLGGRWFDASGALIRPFAIPGEGPGEFRYARDLVVLPGDTVVVGTMQKMAWYAPGGVFVREHKVDWERLRALGRWGECAFYLLPELSQVSCQHDPTIPYSETNRPSRLMSTGLTSPGPGLFRQLRRLFLIPQSLDTVYRLGIDIGIEQQGIDLGGDRHSFVTHPFHARSSLAAGGSPMRIASATNPHWEIEVRSGTGQLLRVIRRDGGRRAPTDGERRAADSLLRSPGGRLDAPDPVIRDKLLAAVITPDSLPGHTQLLISPQGEILSRQWTFWGIGAPSLHDVFDADGKWLGTLTLPPRFQLVEVGDDYLLGLLYDEDELPSVVVYGLER